MGFRGIILAAGRGSRMGKATANKPKCLSKLNGKNLLSWQLESLRVAKIKNIVVVRGYKSDLLSGDFDVCDNFRWNETNMVSSLFCVEKSNLATIVSYSDIAYKPSHVSKLMTAEGDIVITADLLWKKLWELRFENPLDDAETFRSINGRLVEIGSKTNNISEIEAQYMGLLKITSRGWDTLYKLFSSLSADEQDKMDMTTMLNMLLKRKIQVNVVFVKGGWCEADSLTDIVTYEKELLSNKEWGHNWV